MKKIMITGSQGQLGIDILPVLSYMYGSSNILATDILKKKNHHDEIPFEFLDVRDQKKFCQLATQFNPCMIIHFSALLSGSSE